MAPIARHGHDSLPASPATPLYSALLELPPAPRLPPGLSPQASSLSPRAQSSGFLSLSVLILWANSSNLMALNTMRKRRTPKFLPSTSLPSPNSRYTYLPPWCWERLKAGGEGDDRGWDGRMASLTQWTWIWASSRSWEWTRKPGVLQSTGSQRVGHNWGLNWTDLNLPLSTLLTALPCHRSSHARHAPILVCLLQVPSIWIVLLTSPKFLSCNTKVSAQMSPHAEDFFQVLLKYSPFTYFTEFIIMWHYIICLRVHLLYWLYPP